MKMDNKKDLNVFDINRMFMFLLFVEFMNFAYSYIIDSLYFSKIVLVLVFSIIAIVCKFDNSKEKNIKYSFVMLLVIFVYLIFYIPNNIELFSYGFYLLEILLIIVFSNCLLINKVLINYLFVLLIIILELFFGNLDLIFSRKLLFIISFSIFTLFLILIIDSLTSKLVNLLNQSKAKQEEIEFSNNFFKTILEQEKIKIIDFYPSTNRAVILNNNFNNEESKEIPNFFSYIRNNNIISLEYFGLIQNSINMIKKEGFCSIVLPVTYLSQQPIWMKLSGTKVFDKKSNQDKIIVSVTNVNDIKNIELQFKNALNKCSIATWEYDIKSDKINKYSDLVLDYYFYGNPIQDISKTFIARNIVYYEDIDKFNKALEKVKNGDHEVTCEVRIFPSRKSSYLWMRLHFTCFNDSEGIPSYAWVAIENIDDAKTSEKWFEIERKKNLDDYSNLFFMAEINISRNYVINYETKYNVNDKKPKDNSIEAIIDNFISFDIIVKDIEYLYSRLSQEYLLDCYSKGERILEFDYKVITSSNDIIYVSNVTKLFFDINTKEIIAFTFFYDITEKKISKLSLDAIFLRNFVYLSYVNLLNSHMSIRKTQLKDVTNSFNPHRIYKFEWEVFIEKYVHPDDKKYVYSQVDIENIREQMRYKNMFSFDYRISDGGNMITMRRCYFIKASENDPIILIMEQNVSQEMIYRTKNEIVLKKALNKARQAANAKSEFLSRMSHEIRTPLNAIIGLSEIGRSNNQIDILDYFEKIHNSSTYLLGLIDDILDMNKLELGRVKLNYVPVDVKKFYSVILTIIENQAKKKDIEFVYNHQGPYYPYQIIEKLRSQQIILNILNNAIKYTNKNGKVTYRVENIEQDGKIYSIQTICDNGVGISDEFIKDIYKPFSRENNNLSDIEGGTGLGLAICANLIKQLNGNIMLESELDVGTKVTLKFPITVISKEEYTKSKANSKDKKNLKNNFKDYKVLIAEDNQINAMVLKTILNNFGFSVVHAENGESAINIIKKSKENEFSLIFMDIMMPKLDGLKTTEIIRSLSRDDVKNIPILALSANAFEEDVQKSLDVGMNYHLKKPIQMEELLKAINEFL